MNSQVSTINQVGEFASVDDQPLRTSRHETQAACSSKTATTSVNDKELDTPLSVDNESPSEEDLITADKLNQEYSSPVRRSTKAEGNRPQDHLPANDTTTSKLQPTGMGEGSLPPNSLPHTVASSPQRGTHDHGCSDTQQIPLVVKPVLDIVTDENVEIPIIKQHKQDTHKDANAAPTPPDNDQHLADEPTSILMENPNADLHVNGRPKTPNPKGGDERVLPPDDHLHTSKGESTKPPATKNTYNETTDVNSVRNILQAHLDVARKIIGNDAQLGIIRRPNGTSIWRPPTSLVPRVLA